MMRKFIYNVVGILVCVFALQYAASELSAMTSPADSRAISQSESVSSGTLADEHEQQYHHHFEVAEATPVIAIDGARTISVPTSVISRLLRVQMNRFALDLHSCLLAGKTSVASGTTFFRRYGVAVPFSCSCLKEYFIYALRRIII